MSILRVDNIRHNGATSDAITMASDGTCTAKLTSVGGGQLSHRNIIINGAMTIAQRSTSGNIGAFIVDRFPVFGTGHDEIPTQAQVDVAAGTTPYSLGFRKALKVTNGNQTGGAGASDRLFTQTKLEAQDIANSGWNYTDPNSFITLSYWVKSSVPQNFHADIRTFDGTAQGYCFETGTLTADTWTKIVKKIPGNSNLQFDNNNDSGITIHFGIYHGTDYTESGKTMNQWAAYSGTSRMPDNTTTWYETDNATFEYTGVQLEVGDTATSFEHKSEQEELLRCYRYYYKMGKLDYKGTHMSAGETYGIGMSDNDNTNIYCQIVFPVPMREPPSSLDYASIGNYYVRRDTTQTCTGNPSLTNGSEFSFRVNFPKSSHGWGTGQMLWCQSAGSGSYLGFNAEL